MICSFRLWPKKVAQAGLLGLTLLFSVAVLAQDANQGQDQNLDINLKPIPILTGSGAYFTKVTAGQFQDAPSISPLLLVPIGDKLLFEGKGSFSETFSKDPDDTYFENKASYGLAYAQVDYITKYVTVTAGRFITPFNIYGERLAPNWI